MDIATIVSVLGEVLGGHVPLETACAAAGVRDLPSLRDALGFHLLQALAGHPDSLQQVFDVASRLCAGQTVEIASGLAGGKRWTVHPGDNVQYIQGCWDWTFQQALPLVLSKGATYYDVGCNRGFDSLLGASACADIRIRAFDPLPEMCLRTRDVLRLNGYHDAHVLPIAITDRVGSVTFYKHARSDALGSVIPPASCTGVESLTVPCTTLDQLVSQDRCPAVVKIDVEGAEAGVMRGATQTLSADLPPVFLIELHAERAAVEVMDILQQHAYRYFSWFQVPPGHLSVRNVDHIVCASSRDSRVDTLERLWAEPRPTTR